MISEHYNPEKEARTMKEINNEVVIGIVITTFVLSIVITSAFWVIVIYMTRRNRRTIRSPMSPIDSKSENSSHSSKDSGTGDSTKRSYQDLLLTTGILIYLLKWHFFSVLILRFLSRKCKSFFDNARKPFGVSVSSTGIHITLINHISPHFDR